MELGSWMEFGLLIVAIAAAVVAGINLWVIRRERQREKLHDLELSWFVGDLNKHRLHAERLLKNVDQRDTFADLFENWAAENYDSVSAVLRFFYLVDSWATQGYIEEKDAISVFGRSYTWWYWNHIKPLGEPLLGDPAWRFLVEYHGWLDVGFREVDTPLYDQMRNPSRPRVADSPGPQNTPPTPQNNARPRAETHRAA